MVARATIRGQDYTILEDGDIERIERVEHKPGEEECSCLYCEAIHGPGNGEETVVGYPPGQFPPFCADSPYKPAYYRPARPIAPDPDIGDIVDAYQLPYWIGQAFAYLARYKRKVDPGGPLRDLHKALECIQREIIKEERDG